MIKLAGLLVCLVFSASIGNASLELHLPYFEPLIFWDGGAERQTEQAIRPICNMRPFVPHHHVTHTNKQNGIYVSFARDGVGLNCGLHCAPLHPGHFFNNERFVWKQARAELVFSSNLPSHPLYKSVLHGPEWIFGAFEKAWLKMEGGVDCWSSPQVLAGSLDIPANYVFRDLSWMQQAHFLKRHPRTVIHNHALAGKRVPVPSLVYGIAGGFQRAFEQIDGNSTKHSGGYTKKGHSPLRDGIGGSYEAVPLEGGIWRTLAFFGSLPIIGIGAGWLLSRRECRSGRCVLGTFLGAFGLVGVSAFLTLGWPVLRLYGLLP
ncbi:MAG: hypothetical protein ACFCUT_20505 [Kiloniellaceae bacterium]